MESLEFDIFNFAGCEGSVLCCSARYAGLRGYFYIQLQIKCPKFHYDCCYGEGEGMGGGRGKNPFCSMQMQDKRIALLNFCIYVRIDFYGIFFILFLSGRSAAD